MLDRHRELSAAFCGEPLVAHLPAESGTAAGLRICGPNGAEAGHYGELVDEAAGVVWRWTTPGPRGAPPSEWQTSYHWVCPACFERFRDQFDWSVAET